MQTDDVMKTYHVHLKSDASKSYRCKRAADSLDIDVEKKLTHEFSISCDVESDFNVGLIVGASGSGKTTLAKAMFGSFNEYELDPDKPIIDQFPADYDYDTCQKLLNGIGLTQVPCWLRPVKTLSNGQKVRAQAALAMCSNDLVCIDEWTSVVDRTVAKVMSHCVQKYARKHNKRVVLCSCHYDVLEWLNPDWVIDCNKAVYENRRLLWREFKRKEQLKFDVAPCDRSTWRYFSKYHYLSDRLPGGRMKTYGLFHNGEQIGFNCFAEYTPTRQGRIPIYHFNRIVVHPDYCGMALSQKFLNATCEHFSKKYRVKIMGKFSSTPMFNLLNRDPKWRLNEIKRQIGKIDLSKSTMSRRQGFRENIKTYSFRYVGE